MATVKKGVWDLQQVRDQNLEGAWSYESDADPGTLFVFGRNSIGAGQLGQNDRVDRSSPTQIPGTQWQDTYFGGQHSLSTKSDGTLWSYGYNYQGNLGQNNRTNYSSPVQIPGTQWLSVSVGNINSFGIKTDGTLWAWGDGAGGQLGQNNVTDQSSPTQITGTSWSKVSSGLNHTFALKNDGTLWAWGYNSYGELGDNSTTYRSSPVQIAGTQWSDVGGGYRIATGLKNDGTLWTWGRNDAGNQGQNDRVNRSSPIQVPGTQWSKMSNMNSYSYMNFVFKTDGTLWAWGNGSYGSLGQNDRAFRSSPVQIPGTQWKSVGVGYQTTILTKNDGTAYSMGGGLGYGEIDLNIAATARSSPTQIPGTQWDKAFANYANSALRQSI